jgi:flagella basal body P-ring formation protein FlgA
MRIVACITAAVALACAGVLAAPRASIELLPEVEVSGEEVVLGQVARLHSPELGLIRELVQLPIGRVPRNGEPAFVQRGALAERVQRAVGLAAADLAWHGSEVARVTQATRELKGSELAHAATEALRECLARHGIAGALRVARWPRDFAIPAGEVQLRARSLDTATPRRRMVVWVDVWSEGVFLRTVPVAMEVEGSLPSQARDSAVSAVPSAVSPPAPSPLLVERGGWATLRSSDGAVALESRVAVLQDGRAGDHVRVRAPGGGGIVFARVVGRAQLELAP